MFSVFLLSGIFWMVDLHLRPVEIGGDVTDCCSWVCLHSSHKVSWTAVVSLLAFQDFWSLEKMCAFKQKVPCFKLFNTFTCRQQGLETKRLFIIHLLIWNPKCSVYSKKKASISIHIRLHHSFIFDFIFILYSHFCHFWDLIILKKKLYKGLVLYGGCDSSVAKALNH